MVQRTSEQEHLLEQAIIQEEIPLTGSKKDKEPPSNFKEQNLLIVDKKKKFVPAKGEMSE